MNRSRLQKKTIRNMILMILGIAALLFVIIAFGMQFLINFSLVLQKLKGNKDTVTSVNEMKFIAPPVLNPAPDATNSANVIISGYSTEKDQTVKLFVNGKFADKTTTKNDRTFLFKDVTVEPGENELKAKAFDDEEKESEYSNIINMSYLDKPPSLEISSPSDGSSFSKGPNTIKVNGKTDPGCKVTVNDFWALVSDDGTFSYDLKLQNGENKVKVVTADEAGTQTTKEIKVTYSQ